MDWSEIITQLGGGPTAVALAGVGFLYWKERQRAGEERARADALFDRLIEKAELNAAQTLAREKDTIATLNSIAAAIRGARDV